MESSYKILYYVVILMSIAAVSKVFAKRTVYRPTEPSTLSQYDDGSEYDSSIGEEGSLPVETSPPREENSTTVYRIVMPERDSINRIKIHGRPGAKSQTGDSQELTSNDAYVSLPFSDGELLIEMFQNESEFHISVHKSEAPGPTPIEKSLTTPVTHPLDKTESSVGYKGRASSTSAPTAATNFKHSPATTQHSSVVTTHRPTVRNHANKEPNKKHGVHQTLPSSINHKNPTKPKTKKYLTPQTLSSSIINHKKPTKNRNKASKHHSKTQSTTSVKNKEHEQSKIITTSPVEVQQPVFQELNSKAKYLIPSEIPITSSGSIHDPNPVMSWPSKIRATFHIAPELSYALYRLALQTANSRESGSGLEMKSMWTQWSSWSSCSHQNCSVVGQIKRQRHCLVFTAETCAGISTESKPCKAEVTCPVVSQWMPWSSWTPCSEQGDLGSGLQSRTRGCLVDTAAHRCHGTSLDHRDCHLNEQEDSAKELAQVNAKKQQQISETTSTDKDSVEPKTLTESSPDTNQDETLPVVTVAGEWSAWQVWGPCTVTCGMGIEGRRRTCAQKHPTSDPEGGKERAKPQCLGITKKTRSCLKDSCDVGNRMPVMQTPEGRFTKLFCSYDKTKPHDSIFWITPKEERLSPATHGQRYHMKGDYLFIEHSRSQDSGTYHCVVRRTQNVTETADATLVVRTCGNSRPCLNDGQCIELGKTEDHPFPHFKCACQNGYWGTFCQKQAITTLEAILLAMIVGCLLAAVLVVFVCCFQSVKKNSGGAESHPLLKNKYHKLHPHNTRKLIHRNMKNIRARLRGKRDPSGSDVNAGDITEGLAYDGVNTLWDPPLICFPDENVSHAEEPLYMNGVYTDQYAANRFQAGEDVGLYDIAEPMPIGLVQHQGYQNHAENTLYDVPMPIYQSPNLTQEPNLYESPRPLFELQKAIDTNTAVRVAPKLLNESVPIRDPPGSISCISGVTRGAMSVTGSIFSASDSKSNEITKLGVPQPQPRSLDRVSLFKDSIATTEQKHEETKHEESKNVSNDGQWESESSQSDSESNSESNSDGPEAEETDQESHRTVSPPVKEGISSGSSFMFPPPPPPLPMSMTTGAIPNIQIPVQQAAGTSTQTPVSILEIMRNRDSLKPAP